MGSADNQIRKDMDEFTRMVKNLRDGVNQKDAEWDDPQLGQLLHSIKNLASASGSVIRAGEDCERVLKKFYDISSEI